MFGTEKIRLLREQWPNATMLAQELLAIFNDDIPLTQNAPLTLNPPGNQPALNLGQPASATAPIMNFTKGGNTVGGITIDPAGVPQLTDKNGNPVSGAPAAAAATPVAPDQVIFVCKIVAGAGATYTVNLYPSGKNGPAIVDPTSPSQAPLNFTATCVDIDPTQAIPPGRWFLCVRVGPWNADQAGIHNNAALYLQAPVFVYTE